MKMPNDITSVVGMRPGKTPDKKIYVDGTMVKSTTAHGGSNLGTSYRTKHYGYLGWGSKSGSFNDQTTSTHPDDFMQGSIDDVRIYDRALSDNEISALYSVADKHPPLPGNSGTLAASNVSSSGLTLTWTKATDDITDNASLQYKVVRADSDRIRIPETAERNGTLVQNWTVNLSSVIVVDPPLFNKNLRFLERMEDLSIEQFVHE